MHRGRADEHSSSASASRYTAQESRALYDLARSVAGELDVHKLVQTITEAATRLTGAAFGAFFYNVIDPRGESYMLYTLAGVSREHFEKFPMPRNTDVFGPTFRGEGVVRLADVTQDPRYGHNPPYHGMPPGHLPVRSYLAVPVVSRSGHVLGGLFFGHGQPGMFDERAELVAVAVAAQAAIGIDGAHLVAAIEEQKARLQAIVGNMAEGVVTSDAQGNVVDWNPAALQMHGFQTIAEANRRLPDYQALFELSSLDGQLLPLAQWPLSRVLRLERFAGLHVRVRRLDGAMDRVISYSGTPVLGRDGSLTLAVLTLHDITDQHRAQETLRLLAEAGQVLGSSLEFERTLENLAKLAVPRLADWCTIDLVREGGGIDRVTVAHTDPRKVELAHDLRRLFPPKADGQAGVPGVIRTGASAFAPEMSPEAIRGGAQSAEHAEILLALNLRSYICVPLVGAGGRTLGALTLVRSDAAPRFTEADLAIAEELGRRAGLSVENAQLYRGASEQSIKLRRMIDANIIGVVFADDQRILDANDAFLNMVGYSRAEVEAGGLDWHAMTPPEYAAVDQQALAELRQAGVSQPFEKEYIRKDGTRLPVLIAAATFGDDVHRYVCFIQSLRRQRQAEEKRRVSDERFKLLADAIPQLAWMAQGDGHIFWYNRRWYDYTGTTPAQMLGWGWREVHDPRHLPRVVDRWTAHLASGQAWEDTFPLRRHDGEFRWHLSRAFPFRDEDGRVVLWFGTNTDVEDQRRSADERLHLLESERAARQEAERAGRLKDEFLATLSHELRTPLNAIVGWSQLLRNGGLNPEEMQQGIETIERNARAQTQIIEDLLDMSRIISGKIRLDVQRVDLSAVVESAIDSIRPAAVAKSIRLTPLIDPQAGPVSGDPSRLQQVCWNLLNNAIKFTPKGGRVRVVLQRINSHVEVTVSDDGQGIRTEFLPHIFERFRQQDSSTTRRHSGLGLGLSIVKQLVELHGGTVSAASEGEGRGTTFIVSLPLAVVRAGDVDEGGGGAPRRHPRSPGGPCDGPASPSLADVRVLVVDDEPDARDLIRRVLADCKATVFTAASADEGLRMLREHRPDVLLSDIGMPDRDGYDLIRAVRALPPEAGGRTPALALTAFARAEDRTRAILAGYQVHLAKPIEPDELVALVASLAGRT